MSKRHFEALAKVVSNISNDSTRAMVAVDLASEFAKFNPHFDRSRFLKACGL